VETDREMAEILEQDFPALNEANKKGVIEMAKFLVLTQNSIIPGFLGESGPAGTSTHPQEEKRETKEKHK
jgi:hypothetical protein